MNWCARHEFLENVPSHHVTIDDWKNAFRVRKSKSSADSIAWPDPMRNLREGILNDPPGTLLIEDALENIGFGEDMDNEFVMKIPDLDCLKQGTATSAFMRETIGVITTGVYPPESVRKAVDIIFLEANADLFLAKKAIVSNVEYFLPKLQNK